MKIISVVGYSNSGKTTVIEQLLHLLKAQGFTVAIIKNIHCLSYETDREGTDTWRHKKAGADIVVGYGQESTEISIGERVGIHDLVAMFNVDYLFLEGVTNLRVPRIITAKSKVEIKPFINSDVIAVSGLIAKDMTSYHGYDVINVLSYPETLLNLVSNNLCQKEA